MSLKYKAISDAIDKIFIQGSYFHSEYLVSHLKQNNSSKLIEDIINQSGKTPAESIIILLFAIRYHFKDINILQTIENNDSFQLVINEHYNDLLQISIKEKVQGNAPERALPILDVLSKKLPNESVCIIELGASFGLIGHCLLNPEGLFDQKNNYFTSEQKMPDLKKNVSSYLGIDLNPPNKDWLLSCIFNTIDAKRIDNYINSIIPNHNFELIKASALGFTNLLEVKQLLEKNKKIVILTSFMMYQLNSDLKENLTNEINEFCLQNNGHWISQEVDVLGENSHPLYYINFDGEHIINLKDDKCSNWEWLN
jgi:hypothetical protein